MVLLRAREVDRKRNNMRRYSVYDNASGGYTVWYQYYDYSAKEHIMKDYNFNNREEMLRFTKKLERDGYKFVGKI